MATNKGEEFAIAAKGEVHVFLNTARVQATGVWNRVEKKILNHNKYNCRT